MVPGFYSLKFWQVYFKDKFRIPYNSKVWHPIATDEDEDPDVQADIGKGNTVTIVGTQYE